MTSLSSVASTKEIQKASLPQFSSEQQAAMSHYFNPRFSIKTSDWNQIPATDKIWEECISILIAEYKKCSALPSHCVCNRCVEVLNRQKKKGNLKRFLCEHVLTTPDQIQPRLELFIAKMGLNEDRRYTCLVSTLPHIVDCCLIAENIFYPSPTGKVDDYLSKSLYLKGKVAKIEVVDLLLNENSKYSGRGKWYNPIRFYVPDRAFNCECESTIVFPDPLQERIQTAVKKAFLEKVKQIRSTERRKEFVGGLVALAAILVVGVVFSATYSK